MKFLLALSFSLFATASMACTDFTGDYINDAGMKFNYQQDGCESIVITIDGQTKTLITDGIERVLQDDAYLRISASAIFDQSALKVTDRIFYKVTLPPGTPTEKIPALVTAILTKDAGGDITSHLTSYNAAGQVIQALVVVQRKQ